VWKTEEEEEEQGFFVRFLFVVSFS
jgi:hypothetical protein